MRIIVSALVVVSMLGLVAIPASAADDDFPSDFWKQQERNLP